MVDVVAVSSAWLKRKLGVLAPIPSWPAESPAGLAQRAAVLVPIVMAPEPFVLLTRRSARLRHHPGQVSFPGGRADPGDRDAAATALREAQEEIALDPASCELLGCLRETTTFNGRFAITPVVALLPATARWRPSEAEVAAVFGLPLSVLLDPAAPQRITEGPRAGSWSWPHEEEDIWGATARMLLDLARVLAAG
ncbi:CoA pyrophosphatase [Acetobacteraceae bacterium KSS8]|uniref:CoA pyrophosphatase n=1 Tax=Endosaccharibacter trunci TaxID=2812733 RepID=A0ABT1W559_9PROT|nr:CoA pyrophosphatase [Acetobacteraceae bacterium KSS8]